eukprot:3164164-Pyramimonas_sp.AAC.1
MAVLLEVVVDRVRVEVGFQLLEELVEQEVQVQDVLLLLEDAHVQDAVLPLLVPKAVQVAVVVLLVVVLPPLSRGQ